MATFPWWTPKSIDAALRRSSAGVERSNCVTWRGICCLKAGHRGPVGESGRVQSDRRALPRALAHLRHSGRPEGTGWPHSKADVLHHPLVRNNDAGKSRPRVEAMMPTPQPTATSGVDPDQVLANCTTTSRGWRVPVPTDPRVRATSFRAGRRKPIQSSNKYS